MLVEELKVDILVEEIVKILGLVLLNVFEDVTVDVLPINVLEDLWIGVLGERISIELVEVIKDGILLDVIIEVLEIVLLNVIVDVRLDGTEEILVDRMVEVIKIVLMCLLVDLKVGVLRDI